MLFYLFILFLVLHFGLVLDLDRCGHTAHTTTQKTPRRGLSAPPGGQQQLAAHPLFGGNSLGTKFMSKTVDSLFNR